MGVSVSLAALSFAAFLIGSLLAVNAVHPPWFITDRIRINLSWTTASVLRNFQGSRYKPRPTEPPPFSYRTLVQIRNYAKALGDGSEALTESGEWTKQDRDLLAAWARGSRRLEVDMAAPLIEIDLADSATWAARCWLAYAINLPKAMNDELTQIVTRPRLKPSSF